MRKTSKPDNRRRRGVVLLIACFSMPVVIGMIGLGIDVGIMFAIKAKIQMACDGAAVAALRSLSITQTTSSQVAAATSTAIQWFDANFAGNYLGAKNTVTPTVNVVDDLNNHIRTVSVTATTTAPTYFMKFFGDAGTSLTALGQASRRDVVIMMVLDRSGSMNLTSSAYNGLLPCDVMKLGAKQFTGMFQEGRDRIGLATFGESVEIVQTPTTNFQSLLGYTNSSGSGTGAIDNITCGGGTNTSTAISLGWNELYKMQLPGALNSLLVFTDGTPTAGTFNFQNVMASSSGCWDRTGRPINGGGNMAANPRNWIGRESNTGSNSVTFGANSFFADVSGTVGAIYSDLTNPGDISGISPFFSPTGTTPLENTLNSGTESPGCSFVWGSIPDLASIPAQDYWGNSTSGYRAGTTGSVDNANIGNLVFNLADNAANFARQPHVYTNGVTQPAVQVNTIGLGGDGAIDFTLLQRMANDPNGDPGGAYGPYPGYNASQPVGQFIYSPDASQLQTAFTKIASMILRISK